MILITLSSNVLRVASFFPVTEESLSCKEELQSIILETVQFLLPLLMFYV